MLYRKKYNDILLNSSTYHKKNGINIKAELEKNVDEVKLLCSDCSCEELLQPCEACPNYFAQKNHRKK
jgi:hypothetical protein